jgi:hypothetical protein
MNQLSNHALLWIPRVLGIAYIAFVALFALDVFSEHQGVWPTLLAFVIHLAPALLLTLILLLAWRREWLGALLYAALGLAYTPTVLRLAISPAAKLVWILTIAGPAFVIALLFFISWLKHHKPRAQNS